MLLVERLVTLNHLHRGQFAFFPRSEGTCQVRRPAALHARSVTLIVFRTRTVRSIHPPVLLVLFGLKLHEMWTILGLAMASSLIEMIGVAGILLQDLRLSRGGVREVAQIARLDQLLMSLMIRSRGPRVEGMRLAWAREVVKLRLRERRRVQSIQRGLLEVPWCGINPPRLRLL